MYKYIDFERANTIGVLYIKTERIEEAVDAFSRWSEQNAIAIDEKTLWLFCKNVIEYRRTGKPMSLPPELETDPISGACFLEFIYTGNYTVGNRIFNVHSKNNPNPSYFLACLYAIVGQKEKDLESLEQANIKNLLKYDHPSLAYLYAMLGEKEKSLKWLEKAHEKRRPLLLRMNLIPAFDSIRSEPRYITLRKKVGFEK